MSLENKAAKKHLLLLTSKLGYQARSFAEAAARLGITVVFGSDRCHQLDDPWKDAALPLHFERPEEAAAEIVRAAASQPIDAILALGDRPTIAAARAASALGIEYSPPEAVETCRSKLRQRTVLRAAGLPVPEFFSFTLREEPRNVLARVRFPCVVKPLTLSASQGVIRANNAEEFTSAVARIRALLETPELQVTREPELHRLLVEGYIPGREVAVEGVLEDGHLRILALFDKPDSLEGPYFEESIYVTPSRLTEAEQQAIADCARSCVAALELTHGPLHAEFRINPAGPWVIEVQPRPIGGLCSRVLRFGPDKILLEDLLVRHVLGLEGRELEREDAAAGVMMIPVPASGIFEGVEGSEEASGVPGIVEMEITTRVHDYIAAWPEGASYLGFLFARAGSPQEAESALRVAHAKLRLDIRPRLPVGHPVTGRLPAGLPRE
jgi:biotin carboxylase